MAKRSDKKKADEEYQDGALTVERAIKRFLQASDIESTVTLIEKSIEEIDNEIEERRGRRRELTSQKTELLRKLRAAARDEGDLPLLDLMDKFGDTEAPFLTLLHDMRGGSQH